MNNTEKDAGVIKKKIDSSINTFVIAGFLLVLKNITDLVLIYVEDFNYDPFVRHGLNIAIIVAGVMSFSSIKNKRDLDYVKEDPIDSSISTDKDIPMKEFECFVNETGDTKEYNINIIRLSSNGSDRSLIKCVIKISDDITFSYKSESNHSVTKSGTEIFPFYGLSRVTSEFRSSRGSNGLHEYIFGFKLWYDTESENMCTYWTPSFMYSTDYPEGIEDVIHGIQKDIQEAINRVNGRTVDIV